MIHDEKTTREKVRAIREAEPTATARAIAQEVGVSHQRVHQIFRELGYPRKQRHAHLGHIAEYKCWQNMLNRCSNPDSKSYPGYGGRGITVCARWQESFRHFLTDMGPRPSPKHSIDRKDNNGHYEPLNCRWATSAEQMANRRRWLTKLPTDDLAAALDQLRNGKSYPYVARNFGVCINTLRSRAEAAGLVKVRSLKMSAEDVDEAIRALKSGQPVTKVARRFRVTTNTLRARVLEVTAGKKLWPDGPRAKR